jgi:hypothetical protein
LGWQGSSAAHYFLKEAIEPSFVFSRVLLPAVDDESGIAKNPVAEGFNYPLQGLGIGDPDQDFLPVASGELLDPGRQKEVILLYIFRVFIEILVILLVFHLQT